MQVNHNLSATFVNRQIQKNTGKLDKSIEKLSTGMRINRAGDDAANLAVSEKMRTQIRGLKQAEKNALNGLSLIQVAEGNLEQVNSILQRIRELSVQSANGIYSNDDRAQISIEVSQLIDEVNRISTAAEFNNVKLLTGEFAKGSQTGTMFFHVGPQKNQRIRAYIAAMNSSVFGLGNAQISTHGGANQMIGIADQAIDRLTRQRADLGAYYNRMEITIDALRTTNESVMAAESRIRDTDMAQELVEFTKNQILLRSSTAMLAQANFSSQLVLQLLDRV